LIILTDLRHSSEADVAARRLLASLNAPIRIGGREIFVTASLGLVIDEHGGHTEHGELLQHADRAMYRAKRSGSGYVLYGEASTSSDGLSELDLESDLHRALGRDEFVLYYQPVVEVAAGRVVATEALIRWRHPEHGVILPERFIPLAEATGLIAPIGAWTLQTACRQAKIWAEAGLGLPISVNVSARQLAQPGLQATVVQALAQHGLRGDALWLEVTESSIVESSAAAATILTDLKSLGVRIAIDDFGTGYSSLAYLHRFPIDVLKIDGSFIAGWGENRAHTGMEIARAIVTLGKGLRADVVAEGVETPAERDELLAMGCTLMQGYLFGAPMPADAIPEIAGRST